jgi:hypothetical protein
MSRHYDYSVSCIPMQYILIYQLCCEKFLLAGPLCLEGSRAQCRAPILLCIVGATRLLLQVVPPTVELSLRPLLQKLSQSEVIY